MALNQNLVTTLLIVSTVIGCDSATVKDRRTPLHRAPVSSHDTAGDTAGDTAADTAGDTAADTGDGSGHETADTAVDTAGDTAVDTGAPTGDTAGDTASDTAVDTASPCTGIDTINPESVVVDSTASTVDVVVTLYGCATGIEGPGGGISSGGYTYSASWSSLPAEFAGEASATVRYEGASRQADGALFMFLHSNEGGINDARFNVHFE